MIKKAVFITDIHYPYQHSKTIEICKKVCKDIKPDYLIFGGDNWDAHGVSKYTAKRAEEGIVSTYNEMIGFKDKIFTPLIKSCNNTKLKTVLILGNHDGQRLIDFLIKAEERGCYEFVNHWQNVFNYKKIFGCDVIPYNQYYKIGNLYYTHGMYHGKYHSRQHIDAFLNNVIYGDDHTEQLYTKVTVSQKPYQAKAVPCACELNPSYMKNKANCWLNGFNVTQFIGDLFWSDNIRLINGKTIFNGKVYD